MKYLKLYENFEEDINRICHEYGIDELCDVYNITNYVINRDESVDVNENVFIDNIDLETFPFKFGKIRGGFNCSNNELKTLKGAPNEITLFFNCTGNNLTTLIDGPKKVGGAYYCSDNLLNDVYGFPEHFNGSYYMGNNPVEEIIDIICGIGYVNQKYHNESVKGIKFIKWLNEYDVIRPGNKIVEMRLEEAYWMTMKKELPMNKRKFRNYTLI